MADELSEERRRLIYHYMQDGGTADSVSRESDQPTLPSPLPEAVMATYVGPERLLVPVVAAPASPLWQRRLTHLRHRYSREGRAVALVAFASSIGWLVAH